MALDPLKLRAAGIPQDIIKLLIELQGVAGRATSIAATVKQHLFFAESHAKHAASMRQAVDAAKGQVDSAAQAAAEASLAAQGAASTAAADVAPAAAAAIRDQVKADADRAEEASRTDKRNYQLTSEYWGSWNANFADPAFDIATAWGVGASSLTSTLTFWRPAAVACRLRTVRLFAAKAGTVWVFVRKPGTTAGTYVLKREVALAVVAGLNTLDISALNLTVESGEMLGFRQQSGILYHRAGTTSDYLTADHEGWWVGAAGTPNGPDTRPGAPSTPAEDWSIQIEVQAVDASGAPGRNRSFAPDDQIMVHWLVGAKYAVGSTVAESGAVSAVENSITFPVVASAGSMDRSHMRPTTSGNASFIASSLGGGDNALFHMIRFYNALLREQHKVDPVAMDHQIVPRMIGATNLTQNVAALPNLLSQFASGGNHEQYSLRLERIKRNKRVGHVLIEAVGDRDHDNGHAAYRTALLGLHATFRAFVSRIKERTQAYRSGGEPRGRDLVASIQLAIFATATVARPLALAQMEAAAGNPDHVVAGALYPYHPMMASDNRRLTVDGYKALGALLGLMLYTVKARGERWVPMQAVSASVRGGTIRVRYTHPVAIDTTPFALVNAGAGWRLRDPGGAVHQLASAAVDGDELVLTTLAPVAAGWVLEYGAQAVASGASLYGGNIRERVTPHVYEGKPVYRWGLLQDLPLPAPAEDFITLTQAQYDALPSYAPNTTYQIKA